MSFFLICDCFTVSREKSQAKTLRLAKLVLTKCLGNVSKLVDIQIIFVKLPSMSEKRLVGMCRVLTPAEIDDYLAEVE